MERYYNEKHNKEIIAIILCTLTLIGATQSAFAVTDSGTAIKIPYEYNEDGDYYYLSDEDYSHGYNEFYDSVLSVSAMFIDQVRIPFEYEGKKWLVQLWKGQYGFVFIGSDIGVFTADNSADSIGDYSLATGDDRLEIKLDCYLKNKDGKNSFLRWTLQNIALQTDIQWVSLLITLIP